MGLHEYFNIFIGLSMVLGAIVGTIQFFHGYIEYLNYCKMVELGLPPGDPSNGKLWLSWVIWIWFVIPFLNLLAFYLFGPLFFKMTVNALKAKLGKAEA